jgi:poly(3-hydroxybutyrate) depolymerase
MRFGIRTTFAIAFAALAAWLTFSIPEPGRAQPPAGVKGGKGKAGRFAQDPRAETRMYHFEDTNVDLPYSLYVSSKVKKGKKAPLIVTLHGLGAPQTIMMSKTAVDLAEAGGYILVAPMGYNTAGWYGSPNITGGRGRGKGKGAPGVAPGAAKGPGGAPGAAKGKGGFGGFGGGDQPANLTELSEKDVMNVIAMVRKEFNVDDKRIYLMGHSMGGAGALFLGSKYAGMFAAVAAEAPAAFGMNANREEILQKMKDAKVPVMIVHGDADTVVPVTNSQMWVATMKDLKMDYEYKELPGINHGPVIEAGMAPIYEFFAKHKKK